MANRRWLLPEAIEDVLPRDATSIEALRRSLLDLNSQLEAMRSEMAKLRGSNEQLLRDLSELQRNPSHHHDMIHAAL